LALQQRLALAYLVAAQLQCLRLVGSALALPLAQEAAIAALRQQHLPLDLAPLPAMQQAAVAACLEE
jgi:hypothetical protein